MIFESTALGLNCNYPASSFNPGADTGRGLELIITRENF